VRQDDAAGLGEEGGHRRGPQEVGQHAGSSVPAFEGRADSAHRRERAVKGRVSDPSLEAWGSGSVGPLVPVRRVSAPSGPWLSGTPERGWPGRTVGAVYEETDESWGV
jgi:hypothetical protein